MPLSCSEPVPTTVAQLRLTIRSSPRPRHGSAGSGRKIPTDPAIRHWLGAFHQFHSDDDSYAPVALRLAPAEAEILDPNSSPNGSALLFATARHVYEVALRRNARGEKWVLIEWQVDVHGIMFCDCADCDEAMALFAHPAQANGRWYGVRLRPAHRPW